MSYEEIGKAFVQHYYTTFDTNRPGLATLYRGQSMLTFESKSFQGVESIIKHLAELPFAQPQHHILTVDVQPCNGALLVFVSGQLKTGPDENALMFSQVFTLFQEGQNNWFVLNDIFKLNLAM